MKQIQIKEYQKNTISKEQSQDSYNKFIYRELLPHLCRNRTYSKSQRTVARILGTDISTVERIYARLREDPRFFVGKAIRRPNSKYNYTVKVSIFKIAKSCLLEYEGERKIFKGYIYYTKIQSEQLRAGYDNAHRFESVPSGELLAQRRVFAPKYLKGYTETPPNVHKERKIHKGERVSSWASPDDFLPEPQRNSNGLDYDNALTLAEWHDLVDSLGIFNALEFLESGLVSATGLELWEYEEGAVS